MATSSSGDASPAIQYAEVYRGTFIRMQAKLVQSRAIDRHVQFHRPRSRERVPSAKRFRRPLRTCPDVKRAANNHALSGKNGAIAYGKLTSGRYG